MIYKKLGNTDLKAAPVIIGGNVFGWTLNEKASFSILDEAFDLGFKTIDTANSYSHWAPGNKGGESETIIGKWMKHWGDRDELTIITKVGSAFGTPQKDISEKHILKAADDSLRRLQTDYIDLYLTHWDDDKTPVEETLGAYRKLIEAGKVRYVGASNLSPSRLRASLNASKQLGLPRYEVLQPNYNLFDRHDFERELASICEAENLAVITYYSLASGFLSGKYRSEADLEKSARGAGIKKYLNERGGRILKMLDELSEEHQVSMAAVALAWLIHQPVVTAPIASATSSDHLNAFAEAAHLKLNTEELEKLDKASA
ncbi:MAG: aldo/keto reductase [Prolixibacteraceae bacterium]